MGRTESAAAAAVVGKRFIVFKPEIERTSWKAVRKGEMVSKKKGAAREQPTVQYNVLRLRLHRYQGAAERGGGMAAAAKNRKKDPLATPLFTSHAISWNCRVFPEGIEEEKASTI